MTDTDTLIATAKAMVAPGKGILAVDESTETCPKRFAEFISGAADAGLCGQRLKLAHKLINEAVCSGDLVRSDVEPDVIQV